MWCTFTDHSLFVAISRLLCFCSSSFVVKYAAKQFSSSFFSCFSVLYMCAYRLGPAHELVCPDLNEDHESAGSSISIFKST